MIFISQTAGILTAFLFHFESLTPDRAFRDSGDSQLLTCQEFINIDLGSGYFDME